MIKINKNILNLKASATLAINQEVKYLKTQGENVVHFGFGQSPFPVHKSIVQALINNSENNEYLPTLGLKELRIQISYFLKHHQNIMRNWENIFIGPGSKELLYHTILLLEGEFLIPKGSWVSYVPQIKTKGGKFKILNTNLNQNFKLKADTLDQYCKDNPVEQKILILNSPNNPTGSVYTNEELQLLAAICRTHELIVLSDEIYSQINFTDSCSPSMSTYYPEGTIVFGGLSKVFSAGGYRLGFIALPNEIKNLNETYKALFSETFSAVASPIQLAAIKAFEMNDELVEYIYRSKLILKGIGQFIHHELQKLKIQCTHPEGAFYMIIGFNNFKKEINALGIFSSEQLAVYLLNKYKVSFLPGTDFYYDENELFLRLAYVDFNGKKVMENFDIKTGLDRNFIKTNCPNIFEGVIKLGQFVEAF